MTKLTRRSVLRSSLGLAGAGLLARPYIARAAATTATAWWVQGFAHEEDTAFEKLIADYHKASGNTIDYTITPYAPIRQKLVAAMTSGGEVPDLFQNTPTEMLAIYAWENKLVDVSDVIETQKSKFTEAVLQFCNCYNKAEKKRSFYGAPYASAGLVNHIWRPLIEQAGFKMTDLPKTWDAYYDFFKGVQTKLRDQGMRHVFGSGFTLSTTGNDSNNQFNYFVIAYGGKGMVTPDGKPHLDDPKIVDAIVKALNYTTKAYMDGFVPKGAINWNDSDNNNAFHSKQIVMDIDGTISTEVAIISNQQDYNDIVTAALPLSNDNQPIPSSVTGVCGMIPKGAKNVDVAKDFLKYLVQPEISNAYLKVGLGRNIPAMKSTVENDPWWRADAHRKAYVENCLLGDTVPDFFAYNPAYAQIRSEHVWGKAWADIIQNNMTPQAAAEKAIKRAQEIFAEYPIA